MKIDKKVGLKQRVISLLYCLLIDQLTQYSAVDVAKRASPMSQGIEMSWLVVTTTFHRRAPSQLNHVRQAQLVSID